MILCTQMPNSQNWNPTLREMTKKFSNVAFRSFQQRPFQIWSDSMTLSCDPPIQLDFESDQARSEAILSYSLSVLLYPQR